VPTEKRQRQKEGRRTRLEAERKAAGRRKVLRNSIVVVVVAIVVVGTVYLLTRPGPTKPLSAQQQANALAVSAGCPEIPADVNAPANTLKWAAQPAMTIDTSKTYYASFVTTAGNFKVQLNTGTTPVNTNNFIFLANKGFYHCVTFQRVIPGFMNQGGDPTSTGEGGPGYTVSPNEFPAPTLNASKQYKIGAVAMANSCPAADTPAKCPTTNGSQFFIVTGAEGQALPPKYTDFGQVISGLSAVNKINNEGNPNASADGSPPAVINRILSITITSA
jgi:cyclophilin family peptidyl-prolyl cis-trans isomerase